MNPCVLLVLALAACAAATTDFGEIASPRAERCCHCRTGLDLTVTKIEAIGNMKARATVKPTFGTCTGIDRKYF